MKKALTFIVFLYSVALLGQKIEVKYEYFSNGVTKTAHIFQQGNEKAYLKNFHENGQLKSQGWLVNGKKELHWEYYFNDGNLRTEGNYDLDFKTGYWKYFYQNGKLKKEGNYSKGIKTDWWIFYDNKGFTTNEGHYIGKMKNGFHHIFEDGVVKYAGHFVNDEKKGTWVTLNKDGKYIAIDEYGE